MSDKVKNGDPLVCVYFGFFSSDAHIEFHKNISEPNTATKCGEKTFLIQGNRVKQEDLNKPSLRSSFGRSWIIAVRADDKKGIEEASQLADEKITQILKSEQTKAESKLEKIKACLGSLSQ